MTYMVITHYILRIDIKNAKNIAKSSVIYFWIKLILQQESRAAARKPRDAASVLFR